jgi:hypothetical protein
MPQPRGFWTSSPWRAWDIPILILVLFARWRDSVSRFRQALRGIQTDPFDSVPFACEPAHAQTPICNRLLIIAALSHSHPTHHLPRQFAILAPSTRSPDRSPRNCLVCPLYRALRRSTASTCIAPEPACLARIWGGRRGSPARSSELSHFLGFCRGLGPWALGNLQRVHLHAVTVTSPPLTTTTPSPAKMPKPRRRDVRLC